jgi:four helix bundle protein
MNKKRLKLHHEDLDSYQAAIEFLALTVRLMQHFPRGYSKVADQLRRAALSIPLNIAEGYGKRGRNDRANFYDIARGSAHECGAIFDSMKILELVDREDYNQGKALLFRIVSTLVKMAV